MSKFADTNEKIARGAVKTYKTVESGVVKGYKKSKTIAYQNIFNKAAT